MAIRNIIPPSFLLRLALVLLFTFAQLETVSLPGITPAWADDEGESADGDGADGDDGGGDASDGDDGGGDDDGDEDDADDAGAGGRDDDHDSGRDDHEEARHERLSGRVPALGNVLRKVRRTHPGRVLDVRLKKRGKRKIYELKILGRDNRVRIVRVPLKAATRKGERTIIRNYNFGARRR